MNRIRFPQPLSVDAEIGRSGKAVGKLQEALRRLDLEPGASDLARKELGPSSREALKRFQEQAGLQASGEPDKETLARLDRAVAHRFATGSKKRIRSIQEALAAAGRPVAAEEARAGRFGPDSAAAVKELRDRFNFPGDGEIDTPFYELLREAAVARRLESKQQVKAVQRELLRALHVAKLGDRRVDAAELKSGRIGPTMAAAVRALQGKYGLPETGSIDAETLDRIHSLAISIPQPEKRLKPRAAAALTPLRRTARLNMIGGDVAAAQEALAFLGYAVNETEHRAARFGATTRAAVLAYQRDRGLPQTGHLDRPARRHLNREIASVSPQAAEMLVERHRMRGSVRDENWRGVQAAAIEIWERPISGDPVKLAETRSLPNGFYDLVYDPPRDSGSGQLKSAYRLEVRAIAGDGTLLGTAIRQTPTRIAWSNFTSGDRPYRGPSIFEQRSEAIARVGGPAEGLTETPADRKVSAASAAAALSTDDVMQLILAHKLAAAYATPPLEAAACFAFIAQNLPSNLPGDLLDATEDWALVDQLVELAATGLAFTDDELLAGAFDRAIEANLVPIATVRTRDAVLAALANLQGRYALEKPILAGNGTVAKLLDASSVPAAGRAAVTEMFLKHRSFGTGFWDDLSADATRFGGASAVADFKQTVELGEVARNFTPMIEALKQRIADPAETRLNRAADVGRLSPDEWLQIIEAEGGQVPANIEGPTAADRKKSYAATLATHAERLFPGVALVAALGRSGVASLPEIGAVSALIESHPDFDLRADTVDVFVARENVAIGADVLRDARIVQRVHRIAPDAVTAAALIESGIGSAAQVVGLGPDRLAEKLKARGVDDVRTIRRVHEHAQHQYGSALRGLVNLRGDTGAAPAAVGRFVSEAGTIPPELASIPSLETLFGSLDFCGCKHCESVYGPAAYLADLLRFLDQHRAEAAGRTVLDELLARRPDLARIKLNCANTDTPLPYIDLVCEILETAALPPAERAAATARQTTRSAAELRASPEHLKESVYDALRTATRPLQAGFDLWQEETRAFLAHLGISRHQLMTLFRNGTGGAVSPSRVSVAGEYWGISTTETALIVATADATSAKQRAYWDLPNPIPGTLAVNAFLRRSGLDYAEMLDLLSVRWLNPEGDADNVVVERPDGTCDLSRQRLVNLDAARLDKMHRLIRLRRRTKLAFWELDLVLGTGALDDGALARLHQLVLVADRLRLSIEQVLALFGPINGRARKSPMDPDKSFPSLWDHLFQNPSVTRPVDPALALPLAAGGTISGSRSAVLAGLQLSEAEFELLRPGLPNDALSVANLSTLYRQVRLARGLGLPIADFLTLRRLAGGDPFAGPAELLTFADQAAALRTTGFTVAEAAYLLTHDAVELAPGAALLAQQADAIRAAIRAAPASAPASVVRDQVTTLFALGSNAAAVLVEQVDVAGAPLAEAFAAAPFLAQAPDGSFETSATQAAFPNVFAALVLLHKMALAVTRLEPEPEDLVWLIEKAEGFGLLSLGALPTSAAPSEPLLGRLLALADWVRFAARYGGSSEQALRHAFDLAGADPAIPFTALRDTLAGATGWSAAEIDDLKTALGLIHAATGPSDYARIETYWRLEKARSTCRRLGVSPATARRWALRDDETDGGQKAVAREARAATKAKYSDTVWLERLAPIENKLREQRRDALVVHHLAEAQANVPPTITEGGRTYPNPAYWNDANDLLRYFVIDVEMSACQLTSRIKQATASVQMFVQRCLLGLEQPRIRISRSAQLESVSDNSWRQWEWMKTYRLWEANRKVFLYPENWIEPELRDDKSPFFKELENEILQAEISDESAAAAFEHYVERVNEVARLDIVGTYYEIDDTEPGDNLPPDVNQLHVIGRTRTHPAIYFYRKFDLNYGEWSAWQRIDVDIEGDQVLPVVYNRRLYLFWLNVIQKPQKIPKLPAARLSENPSDTPEPPLQIEIQLSWSAQTRDGWTPKRLSRQKLIHPWQRPLFSYSLKPRYKSRENQLWIDVYISQSTEFNDGRFWDAFRSSNEYATSRRYDPNARPWHSSSFVFDGDVVDFRLKPLAAVYHIGGTGGMHVPTDSLNYVRNRYPGEARDLLVLDGAYHTGPRLPMPDGMQLRHGHLINQPGNGRVNVLENAASRTILNNGRSPFRLVTSQHSIRFDTAAWGAVPFFYQDQERAFFVRPEWHQQMLGYNRTLQTYRYRFFPAYHAYGALFLRELKRGGVAGLVKRQLQIAPQTFYPGNAYQFSNYGPVALRAIGDVTALNDRVDFSRSGAYSIYNWEIFFHAPLMIACRLMQNRRFAEAMRWFHYIFDPTNVSGGEIPQRYWVTRPFYEQSSEEARAQRIQELLRNVGLHDDEITAWKNNPFKPHLIARFRPLAYQKAVVMKYIDNLIVWGDHLFRQDTIEAINEATTLYVLAHELLGRRPVEVPSVDRADRTYEELAAGDGLDAFGNEAVEVIAETFAGTPTRITRTDAGAEPLPMLRTFYFGIPNNGKLLDYWGTVEDRLFKIRHCMNIQGVVRQLPLFDPPIDPALLVRAAAAGIDLASVLAGPAGGDSPYRFRALAARAAELCHEVQSLGDRLLAALEKRDAEALSLLRSRQEVALHEAMTVIKEQRIEEASNAVEVLQEALATAQAKHSHYHDRALMNGWEIAAMAMGGAALLAEPAVAVLHAIAAAVAPVPAVTAGAAGAGGSPQANVEPVRGERLSKALENAAKVTEVIAKVLERGSELAEKMGHFAERKEEWDFEAELAEHEMHETEKRILGAEIALQIAEKELEVHSLQIEQAKAEESFLRTKHTNEQLYEWQVGQLSTLYFAAYQLAFDTAQRAERCYRLERGDLAASFVRFGHWDSLKKGLQAGDRLLQDVRRMETAYLEDNRRDLEITKHVSLARFFPAALLQLKAGGSCTVSLPEWLFDLDYPGHLFRRLKSVSISIPAVVGPYGGVNCTLTLVNHGTRVDAGLAGGYGDPLAPADERFVGPAGFPAVQRAIATSHAQSDPGMFELRFDDERYLPFEGAGAVSTWRLDMPADQNAFDLATVHDVVLHVWYTARASGDLALAAAAKANVDARLPEAGLKLLVLDQEFPDAWHHFLHASEEGEQRLEVEFGADRLPFWVRGRAVRATRFDLIVEGEEGTDYFAEVTRPGAASAVSGKLAASPDHGSATVLSAESFGGAAPLLGTWQVKLRRDEDNDFVSLPVGSIRHAYLLIGFELAP